jgi:hypothetical protein
MNRLHKPVQAVLDGISEHRELAELCASFLIVGSLAAALAFALPEPTPPPVETGKEAAGLVMPGSEPERAWQWPVPEQQPEEVTQEDDAAPRVRRHRRRG